MKFKLKQLGQLSIAQKLLFSFSGIVGLLLVLATLSYLRLSALNHEIKLTNSSRYPNIVLTHDVKDQLNTTINIMHNMLAISDADDLAKEYPKLEGSAKIIADALAKLSGAVSTPEAKDSVKMLLELKDKYAKYQGEFTKQMRESHNEEAKTTLQYVVQPVYVDYVQSIYLGNIS